MTRKRWGWGLYRQTTYTLTSHLSGQRRAPVLLSLKQVASAPYELPTRKLRRPDTVRRWLLERRAVSPEPAAWLPAKSDAVIAPCAADTEPPFPSRTHPVPLWLAVAAAVRMWSPQRNGLQPSASIGEEDEMFFPLSPVPFPPSKHHPLLHLPHRR